VGRLADPTVIAIGASTGGTLALEAVLTRLSADTPPIVIVQHTLPTFTAPLARRLDMVCPMRVEEAQDGHPLRGGVAVIAPGGSHLVVERRNDSLCTILTYTPPLHFHRPSVDVLFQSLARIPRVRVVAVLLTGMGHDGAEGMLALRQSGAHTIVQDEQSSAVYGMPKAAKDRGAALYVSSLDGVAARISSCIQAHRPAVRPSVT